MTAKKKKLMETDNNNMKQNTDEKDGISQYLLKGIF